MTNLAFPPIPASFDDDERLGAQITLLAGQINAANHRLLTLIAEFDQRNLSPHIVAEIDSLSLLMNCVYEGIGATIKPMAAVYLEGARGRQWRALPISDARMIRRNFLYSLPPKRLSTAAAVVASELRSTAKELVESGAWSGVKAMIPAIG